MHNYAVGDRVVAIFTEPLPGNDVAPPLKKDETYTVGEVFTDELGNQHLDVGLPCEVKYVTNSFTGDELPTGKHWCHPNRFIKKV